MEVVPGAASRPAPRGSAGRFAAVTSAMNVQNANTIRSSVRLSHALSVRVSAKPVDDGSDPPIALVVIPLRGVPAIPPPSEARAEAYECVEGAQTRQLRTAPADARAARGSR